MNNINSYNERHKDDTTLFVFHTINTKTDKPTGWNYNPLPAGWNWIGASGQSEGGYTREEQLMGPKKSKAAALKQITKVLTKLKADGILTKFKVRQSYKPGTTKTKKGRKSPAESASQFEEGTVKTGQNGNNWVIVKDKRGVGRWTRSSEKVQRRHTQRKSIR
jgi:hypothetical protein